MGSVDVTLLHHTLPLGVTVALHQACLVAKNDASPLEKPLPGQQAGPSLRGFRKEGTKRSGTGSSCIRASGGKISFLNAACFGPSARQRLRDPFLPYQYPLQFLLASNFYDPRSVTVGWLDSDSYFSTAEMPWTKPVVH